MDRRDTGPQPMPAPPGDGWNRYEEYVLRELDRQSRKQEAVLECLSRIKADIAGLRARAGAWGAIAGIIGGVLVAAAVKAMTGG